MNNKIVIVGDIHWKDKEPYISGLVKLWKYLLTKYKEYTLIQTGDWFDTSSPNWHIVELSRNILKQFYKVYIIDGNHDKNYQKGNSLISINEPNVLIISEYKCIEINGISFSFFPHPDTLKEKENYLEKNQECDYAITHIMPVECQFGKEGIELPIQAKTIIHGHHHVSKRFKNKEGIDNIVLGVPQPTRNGEQHHQPQIITIEDDKLELIDIPIFMSIKDVEYGDDLTDKNHLYNVNNAPSIQSVFEKYKELHIREEGVTIKRSEIKPGEIMEKIGKIDFSNLETQYVSYAEDNEYSKEVVDITLDYFAKVPA